MPYDPMKLTDLREPDWIREHRRQERITALIAAAIVLWIALCTVGTMTLCKGGN
jgi:hypothetical protein